MKQTVVGVFDRYESARHAANLLADSGFGPDAVHVTDAAGEDAAPVPERGGRGMLDSIRSFFAEVFGSEGDAQQDISEYAEAVRRGGAVVKVDVEDEPRVDEARQLLQSAGAVNIDERVAEWRQEGWSGTLEEDEFERTREEGALGTRASAGSSDVVSDAGTIGMPADTVPGTARSDSRFEGANTGEEDVIPVLKEEIEVGKRAVSRGGVRVYAHTVERPVQESLDLREGGARGRTYEDYTEDFHSDWRSNYSTLGGTYEDYDPAYRYGHSLAGDTRYGGRRWEEIEPDVRSDWERQHPGSAWERFKAAVRHGWERMSG